MTSHLSLRISRTALAALFSGLGFTNAAPAFDVLIDTDALTINYVSSGGEFRGTTFLTGVRASDGAAEFVFQGDLNLRNQWVNFTGNRGASLVVLNNADLTNSRIDASAWGR